MPSAVRRLIRQRGSAASDQRGIALQTVIIMVVLVVIAGAVATILVQRAGTETQRLEEADTTIDASKYGNETLCEMAGYKWSSGSCGTAAPTPSGDGGDGPTLGDYQAQWSSDGGSTWTATEAAYTAGEADPVGDNSNGAAAGTFQARWSSDGGQTWASTSAAKTAYDAGELRS